MSLASTVTLNVLATVSGLAGFGQLQGQLNGAAGAARGLGAALKLAVAGMGVAVIAQGAASMREWAEAANRAEVSTRMWQKSLERFKVDQGEANALVDDLSKRFGVLPETVQGAATMLLRGGASLETIQKAFLAAGSSAIASGKDTTRAIENIAEAVVTGRSELTEAAGIIVNSSDAYKAYAKAVGKSTDALTEQEKQLAFANAMYAESKYEILDAGEATQGYTGVVQENTRAKAEFAKTMGQLVLPIVTRVTQATTGLITWFTGLVRATREAGGDTEKLAAKFPLLARAIETVRPVLQAVQAAVGPVVRWFGTLMEAARESGGDVQKLAERFPWLGRALESARPLLASLVAAFQSGFKMIAALWTNFLQPAIEAIWPVVKRVFEAIAPILKAAFDQIKAIFDAFTALFNGDWEGFLRGLVDVVKTYVVGMLTAARELWGVIMTAANDTWPKLQAIVQSWGDKLTNGVRAWMTKLRLAGLDVAESLLSTLREALPAWFGIGQDIVDNLIAGIRGKRTELDGALEGLQQQGDALRQGGSGPAAPSGAPTPGFTASKGEAIAAVARRLGVRPNDLAAIISFETAGTFSPNARNPGSSATGLIQFMADRKGQYYGMSRDVFGSLGFDTQMQFVERFLRMKGIQPGADLGRLYDAVAGYGYSKFSPRPELREGYKQNAVWDANGDGTVARGEAVTAPRFRSHIRNYYGTPVPAGARTGFFGASGSGSASSGSGGAGGAGGAPGGVPLPSFDNLAGATGANAVKPGQVVLKESEKLAARLADLKASFQLGEASATKYAAALGEVARKAKEAGLRATGDEKRALGNVVDQATTDAKALSDGTTKVLEGYELVEKRAERLETSLKRGKITVGEYVSELTKLQRLASQRADAGGPDADKYGALDVRLRSTLKDPPKPEKTEAERGREQIAEDQRLAAQRVALRAKLDKQLAAMAVQAEKDGNKQLYDLVVSEQERRAGVRREAADRAARDRQEEAERTARDAKEAAERSAANQLDADRALASGSLELARDRAEGILETYEQQRRAAGTNAAAVAQVEEAWADRALAARNTRDRAAAGLEKQRLERERNERMNAEGLTKKQREALWDQYARRIANVDAGLNRTLEENARRSGEVVDEARRSAFSEEHEGELERYNTFLSGTIASLEGVRDEELKTLLVRANATRDLKLQTAVIDEMEKRRTGAAAREARQVEDLAVAWEDFTAETIKAASDKVTSGNQYDRIAGLDMLQRALDAVQANAPDALNLIDDLRQAIARLGSTAASRQMQEDLARIYATGRAAIAEAQARNGNSGEGLPAEVGVKTFVSDLARDTLNTIFDPEDDVAALLRAVEAPFSAAWSDLGDAGREEFWGSFGNLLESGVVDKLGEDALRRLLKRIGDGEEWAGLRAKVEARLATLVDTKTAGAVRDSFVEVGQSVLALGAEFQAGTRDAKGFADGLLLAAERFDALAVAAEAAGQAGQAADLRAAAQNARDLAGTVTDATASIRQHTAALDELERTGPAEMFEGETKELSTLRDTLIATNDTAYKPLIALLDGLIARYGRLRTARESEARAARELRGNLAGVLDTSLVSGAADFSAGRLSAKDFGADLVDVAEGYDRLADAADRAGDAGASEGFREQAAAVRAIADQLGGANALLLEHGAALDLLESGREEAPFAAEVRGLADVRDALTKTDAALYAPLIAGLDALIKRYERLRDAREAEARAGRDLRSDSAASLDASLLKGAELFTSGQRGAAAFAADLADLADGYEQLADAAERAGDARAAEGFRTQAQAARSIADQLAAATSSIEDHEAALSRLESGAGERAFAGEVRGLTELRDGLAKADPALYAPLIATLDGLIGRYTTLGQKAGETALAEAESALAAELGAKQPLFQAEIKSLEVLKKTYPELSEKIDVLIGRYRQLADVRAARQAFDDLIDGARQFVEAFASIASSLKSPWSSVLSLLGQGVNMLKGIPDLVAGTSKAFTSGGFTDMLGALGGWAGLIAAGINLIGQIGDAILSLDPGFQAWISNLREVAAAEREVAKDAAGIFENPYKNLLSNDAAAREALAGADWWQRFAWSIFGGAPQVLSDEAAKLAITAAQIFNDLGATISNSLESGLMAAWETGEWDNVEASFDKALNTFLAKMALQAVIAGSKLGELIKKYADDYAAAMADGSISADEQKLLDADIAAIRAGASSVRDTWKGIAPTLPGYGQGAGDKPPAGSVADYQQQIGDLRRKQENAKTAAEFAELQKEIDKLQAKIDAIQGQGQNGAGGTAGAPVNETVNLGGGPVRSAPEPASGGTITIESVTKLEAGLTRFAGVIESLFTHIVSFGQSATTLDNAARTIDGASRRMESAANTLLAAADAFKAGVAGHDFSTNRS